MSYWFWNYSFCYHRVPLVVFWGLVSEMEVVWFQFGVGQEWTSGILPVGIWHVTDTERAWEEIPLLAWAQASEQAPDAMPPSFVTGCRTLCSAAEYLQHLQDQRDAAKKAPGEKFWPTFTFGTALPARSRWTVNRPSVEGPPWLAQRALAGQSKAKSSTTNSQRWNSAPLLPSFLGNFLGERVWRLQIQLVFLCASLSSSLFLLLVLHSAALGCVWRSNLLSVVAWTGLSYWSHRIFAGFLLLGNINEKKCYTSVFFQTYIFTFQAVMLFSLWLQLYIRKLYLSNNRDQFVCFLTKNHVVLLPPFPLTSPLNITL